MKNKSFLSKFEELKPKVPVQLEVERRLLPRLKFMGYVMCILGLTTVAYAVFIPKDPRIGPETAQMEEPVVPVMAESGILTDEDPLELTPNEVLNFYAVALIFAGVGASCFLIAWKKRKALIQETQMNGE